MVTPDSDKSHTVRVWDLVGSVAARAETAPAGTRPVTPRHSRVRWARVGWAWVAVLVAVVVLVFLLIFILQNLGSVTVRFLGVSGTLPVGDGLLFAAVAGALLVFLIGTARIIRLRRVARRARAAHRR
jgi:uncharacterized integral membrane protein